MMISFKVFFYGEIYYIFGRNCKSGGVFGSIIILLCVIKVKKKE